MFAENKIYANNIEMSENINISVEPVNPKKIRKKTKIIKLKDFKDYPFLCFYLNQKYNSKDKKPVSIEGNHYNRLKMFNNTKFYEKDINNYFKDEFNDIDDRNFMSGKIYDKYDFWDNFMIDEPMIVNDNIKIIFLEFLKYSFVDDFNEKCRFLEYWFKCVFMKSELIKNKQNEENELNNSKTITEKDTMYAQIETDKIMINIHNKNHNTNFTNIEQVIFHYDNVIKPRRITQAKMLVDCELAMKKQELLIGLENGEKPDNITEADFNHLLTDYNKIKISKIDNDKKYYGWFMLSFRPEATLDKILKVMKLISSKDWLQGNFVYSLEQRGKTIDDMGKGIHCHCLFIRPDGSSSTGSGKKKRPSHCLDEFKNALFGAKWRKGLPKEELLTMEAFCYNNERKDGQDDNNNARHHAWLPKYNEFTGRDNFTEKYEYMLGIKQVKEKMDSVTIDKLWRTEMGILPIYGEIKGCIVPLTDTESTKEIPEID